MTVMDSQASGPIHDAADEPPSSRSNGAQDVARPERLSLDKLNDLGVEPPVTVLSDLHLAHAASYIKNPDQLIPLLGRAKTIVFNGDTGELLSLARRDEARRQIAQLCERCHDHGARPIFLTGNHDPTISSAHSLDLFGGRVFLTHGDVLHPMVATWSREGPAMWEERQRLLRHGVEPTTLEGNLLLTKRITLVAALYTAEVRHGLLAKMEMLGRFIFKPWRILLALEYWANVAHYSHHLKSAHRPDARLMLIGHTHRAGIWQAKDYTLVNTGSYQPLSKPLIVFIDERRASIHRVISQSGQFQVGPELYHRSLT